MDKKEECLKWICERSASAETFKQTFVCSCTWIARALEISDYQARKYMRELAKEGYVVKDHEGGRYAFTNELYCIHGYRLTVKGKNSEYYKNKHKRDVAYWEKILSEGEAE